MSDSVRSHIRQPTRLPPPWDSPGKNTGVGCHFLLQCVKVKSLSRVLLFATPWTAAYRAPPSMGFSRQEYWSGVPSPSPIHTHTHTHTHILETYVQHQYASIFWGNGHLPFTLDRNWHVDKVYLQAVFGSLCKLTREI